MRGIARVHLALTSYLILLSVLGMMAIDIFLPALPSIASGLSVSDAKIQAIFSSYFLGVAVAQLVCGPLSDHYGRRPVLLGALLLCFGGGTTSGLAHGFDQMILGRLMQGLGSGVTVVIWRSIAFDMLDTRSAFRMIANVVPAIVISPAVAPIIGGGLLAWLGWRSAFLFLAAMSSIAFLVTLLFFPESHRPDKSAGILKRAIISYKLLFTSKLFLSFSWLLCAAYAGYFLYIAQSPLILTELGHSPQSLSFLYIPVAVFFLMGSSFGKRFDKSLSPEALLSIGTALFVAGGVGIVLFCEVGSLHLTAALLAAFSLVVLGNGITLTVGPARLIASFPGIAGASSALIGLLQSLTTATVTMLLSLFNEEMSHYNSLAILFGVCVASIAASYFTLSQGFAKRATEALPAQAGTSRHARG